MIVGNNTLLRKGIFNVLESGQSFDICCEATTKLEILECCYSKEIDLAIVLDDSSDPDDIFETTNFLKNEISDIKILILYLNLDGKKELKMIDYAVNGVISYKESNINIPLAIHSIMKGDLWYRREILNNYVKQGNSRINIKITGKDKKLDLFSLKEKQIIAFASQGYANKDIGIKLTLSEITVKNYLYRIYKKLNINNRKQLRAYQL